MREIERAAEQAADELHRLYWQACDEKQRAIDPEAMGLPQWAVDMLAEAFELAMYCEAHPQGWFEGRARI